METTYQEFCELLELTPEQAASFAAWQEEFALRRGVKAADCVFNLSDWYWNWELFNDADERAQLEAKVKKGRECERCIGDYIICTVEDGDGIHKTIPANDADKYKKAFNFVPCPNCSPIDYEAIRKSLNQ